MFINVSLGGSDREGRGGEGEGRFVFDRRKVYLLEFGNIIFLKLY